MKQLLSALLVLAATLVFSQNASAQLRYQNNKLIIGNTEPVEFYNIISYGAGMYLKCKTSNFFQIDVTPAATRLASHGDQVVFFNTKTSTFNSIQVQSVYNYSDARAKTGVKNLSNGLEIISKLRPVSYNFRGDNARRLNTNPYTGSNSEIGLIAQEVATVLPNIVTTNEDGQMLVNYTALIPVLIESIQTLKKEVEELKANKK